MGKYHIINEMCLLPNWNKNGTKNPGTPDKPASLTIKG
jgi:hypothetical protein